MLVVSVENLGQRQLVGVIVAGGMNKGRDWQTGSLFRGWGEPGTGTGGTGVRHPDRDTGSRAERRSYSRTCVVHSLSLLLGFLSSLSIYGVAPELAGDWLLLLGDCEIGRKQKENQAGEKSGGGGGSSEDCRMGLVRLLGA